MNRIITGECRAVMRELIASGAKAQCVVTSPPYWGLRSYGTPPVVWGGRGDCAHEWGDDIVVSANTGGDGSSSTLGPKSGGNGISEDGIRRSVARQERPPARSNFCNHCNAWRGELGLEPSVFDYIKHMVEVFDLVRELMHDDGVCFVNIGDTYITRPNGSIGYNSTINGLESQEAYRIARTQVKRTQSWPLKMKDMALVPQRLAIALQEAGWWVRQDIIWHKPNPMPGSYEDRFTTSHEYVWLLAKSERYYFDEEAVKEPSSPNSHARMARAHGERAGVNPKAARWPSGWDSGEGGHKDLAGRYPRSKQNASFSAAVVDLVGMRKKRDVWTISTTPYSGSHYATFPEALVQPCILAGTSARGHCPKCGAGWVRIMGDPMPAPGPGSGNKERKDRADHGGVPPNGAEAIGKQNQAFGVPWKPTTPVTIGWEPGCACQLEPVPAVVFDPFMGTGTVAKVATNLGRHYLGCDLDTKNEPLQAERMGGTTMGLALA